MSKIFTKVSKEQIITLLQQYNLPVSFLPITPSIVSKDIELLLGKVLSQRSSFEIKKKYLKISEDHLYNYLKDLAVSNRILLKSNLSYYDQELVAAGLLKLKIGNKSYYVAK